MQRPWVSSPSYAAALQVVVAARQRAGLSQRQLAERMGKPPSYIAKLETRVRRLDMVEMVALAEALGARPEDLIGEVARAMARPLEF